MDEKRLEELEKFLQDARGFLHWAEANKNAKKWAEFVAGTLSHDIHGLAVKTECFLPRVSGYAKYTKKSP